MEISLDGLLAIGIILLLFIIIYTKIRDQSIIDSINEIKELITGGKSG